MTIVKNTAFSGPFSPFWLARWEKGPNFAAYSEINNIINLRRKARPPVQIERKDNIMKRMIEKMTTSLKNVVKLYVEAMNYYGEAISNGRGLAGA